MHEALLLYSELEGVYEVKGNGRLALSRVFGFITNLFFNKRNSLIFITQ